jgi:hypothetical protein
VTIKAYKVNSLEELLDRLKNPESKKWRHLIISGKSNEIYRSLDFGGVSTVYQIDIEQKFAKSIEQFPPEIEILVVCQT